MKKKIFITIFMLLLILQIVAPTKVNAVEKNPIFNSNITFTWDIIENEDIMNYGLCTPSNADDYEEIPLIIWLHGKGAQGGRIDKIKEDPGLPNSILSENTLERFCAYVVCPHIPYYDEVRNNMERESNRSTT